MAGPTASILLRTVPDEVHKGLIYNVLGGISSERDGNDFWVNDTLSIGGKSKTEGRPFGICFNEINENYHEHGELELIQIEAFTGFAPKFDLGFYAMCNDGIDHRILGELTYSFAKKLNGIIDFNGAIYTNKKLNEDWLTTVLAQQMKWQEIQTYHEEFARDIKGNLYSISYETSGGLMAIAQICDAEFMKNWLKHDRFHMIK